MYVTNNLTKINIGHNNISKKNNSTNPVTQENTNLTTPCDAKYILNHSNINFRAKYNIKRLNLDEFEKIKQEVLKKAGDLRIRFNWLSQKSLSDYNQQNSDIIAQTLNILFNHKIINLESVKDKVDNIITSISTNNSLLDKINNMFEFADFITSEELKSVYEHESVQDEMGNILYDTLSRYSVDYKKKFVNYLNDHKEILLKDVKIGKYIQSVNENSYDTVLNNILKKEPPIDPTEGLKETTRNNHGLFDVFRDTDINKTGFGKIVSKSNETRSGFARVGGQSKAIEQLEDLVIFPMKYPQFYKGINTEKGAILYGPPGTGKSLMADALAEELGRYYVKIGASDMEDKFVGGTKDKWIELFNDLKEHQPSFLFIDEFDALGKKRGGVDVHGDKQLNCFLKLVSDIKAENLDVFILGATNKPEELDNAILRDGRFGAHIKMEAPQTVKDIEEIFNIHTSDLPLDNEDMTKNQASLFKMMLDLGLSGAAIEGVVIEAHRNAIKRLGLRAKMKAGTVTKFDEGNFKIKISDFIEAINKRDELSNAKKPKIGYY